MSVEPELAHGGRQYREVEPACIAFLHEPRQQAAQDDSLPLGRIDGEQAHLADTPSRGKVLVERVELMVERKGAPGSQGQHANQAGRDARQDEDSVALERVDQPSIGAARVLRNLLREGPVVQAADLVEVAFGGELETQRRLAFSTIAGQRGAAIRLLGRCHGQNASLRAM